MSTLTIELPERIASELEASGVTTERLRAFLLRAVEAWLRRRSPASEAVADRSWAGAFEENAARFVDRLIDDNQELFEELARR